jgi:hypothetical protein
MDLKLNVKSEDDTFGKHVHRRVVIVGYSKEYSIQIFMIYDIYIYKQHSIVQYLIHIPIIHYSYWISR